MARPTKDSDKMLKKLAAVIQAQLDALVEQYDERLAGRPGYDRLPAPMRRDLERQLLNVLANALAQGDSRDLVEYIRQRAVQWVAAGLDIAWFQDALVVPEEILVPLIDSVAGSTFLWRALNRSQGAIWGLMTERVQQAELQLAEHERLLQLVMDNIPQLIFWKDRNSNYLGCNQNFAQAAGVGEPANIVGKSDYDLAWKKEESDAFRRDDAAVMASGQPKYHIIEPQLQADGRQTWADTNKIPLHNAAGEVIGVLGTYEDITERKRAEETIRDSEERLRAIYEGTNDAVMLLNERGFFDCNPRTLEMFGFGNKEAFTAVHPADVSPEYQPDGEKSWPAAQAHIQAAYQHGYERFEWVHRRANGQDFPAEVLLSAFDLRGQRVLQATVRDITERKAAEAALANERNLLRTLIDNLPDQVFIKDTKGRIVLYNQADARAMGVTSTEEALGKTVYDLYPRELADLYNADDMAVIHSDQSLHNREEPGLDPQGEPRWILTTKVPLKDGDGNPLGLVGVARDITARRQMELKLQQSEERFRRFSEATSEGLVFHENGVILDANPAIVAMFGYATDDEMISRNILEVIVPDCRALVLQKMQLEDVHPYEIECIRQDGTIFPVETATRTYQHEGRTVRASSLRDITRRKQLERTIRESYDRRGRQVEVSRQVAQEIAATTEAQDIFPLVVKLIKERFDYYHAQIFRYDPTHDAVVLVAGYGEAGQQMLAAGHQLALGRGVVGVAAQTGKSILATESSHDVDWRPNPSLPATKGELAVPIRFQDEILGILDVQSDRANALDQDDVLLLEGLAGQIAVAIANNRILTERKIAEQRLADAVRLAKIGYWSYDVPTDTFTFNDQFYTLMRTTAEREGGYTMTSSQYAQRFVHPEDAPLVGGEIGKALAATDPNYRGEVSHRVYFGDGELGYVTVRFTIEKDSQGQTIRTSGANQDITDIRRAEQELRTSEAQLSQALQIAKLAYWEYDVENDLFLFNDQFFAIFHTTAAEHGGYQLSSAYYAQHFVYPEDLPVVGAEIAQALNSTDRHYSRAVEHRILYGDGGIGYISVNINIDRDEQGKILRYYGANQDITERKQAEAVVRRSEAELAEALKIAKLAYWEYDVENDLFLFNDQFFSLFHTTAAEHGGYQLSSAYYAQHFVYPEDLPIVGAEIERALTSTDQHYSRSLEHRIQYADGGIGYISVSINIDRDEQGKILRYYGANQDITERKQAEAELERSEQLMRNVINSTPDWIFIKDQEHRYQLVNQGYADSLHIPIDGFIGRNDLDLGFPEELVKGNPEKGLAGFWADDRAVMDSGKPKVIPNDIVAIDGAERVFHTIKTPLRNAAGNVWGVLAFGRDVTEREQLLQDVQRRANQVQAVAEVGAAAAELREPQALLEHIVRLTRRRFNLYHCHIFLLDETGRTLKVRACGWHDPEDENRPAGDREIAIDATQSLVARAARTHQPVIDNDVHADPGWLPNPQLPDVQSEMALPMIVGNTVLGVFNVHSDELNHFREEDARTMLTLATQTAIALQNARLFEETQRAAEEMDRLNRRLTGEAWEAYLHRKTRDNVIVAQSQNRAAPAPLSILNELLAAGQVVVDQAVDQAAQTITAPIVLRGQTVGALRVQADRADWSEDLQGVLTTLAGHIAQAVENTRLLEESEVRFARERALGEATDRVRRSGDVERILETAAAELAQYLQTHTVSVHVGSSNAEAS